MNAKDGGAVAVTIHVHMDTVEAALREHLKRTVEFPGHASFQIDKIYGGIEVTWLRTIEGRSND